MKMKARIVQGDDVDLIFNAKNKDGIALDLTGASAITFKAKKTIKGDAYISKTLGAGVSLGSPASEGEITVTLTDTDTNDDNLPAGTYLFELQITDSAGNIMTVRDFNDVLGELEVLADLDQ